MAVYNHYKRIYSGGAEDVELQSNVWSGPHRLHKGCDILVPFAIADATTLTEAGYVGDDVEITCRLVQAADYDVALAERGTYIDEIDTDRREEREHLHYPGTFPVRG